MRTIQIPIVCAISLGFLGVLPCVADELPAKVLDLSSWKLTLPIAEPQKEFAREVKQPQLATFSLAPYFVTSASKDGVLFRAPCGGITTKGSSYPRCELREMDRTGRSPAAWSTNDGNWHSMTLRAAITKTPPVKKHVVCAQIHDSDDDLLMVRLENTKLIVERNELGEVTLDSKYKIGTPFSLKIEAQEGQVKVWYNDRLGLDWNVTRQGCYFKAGCYTQSNPAKGDSADSYGEVIIYRLNVEHLPSSR